MNMTLFFSVFITFGIVYTIIGLFASKNIKNNTDYFLAGKDLGLFAVMATLIATQVGGGMILGTTAEAFNTGLYGITYTLGMSIGFLLFGLGIASKLQSIGVATTAELFETKYKSVFLKKAAALLQIITMSGVLIAQIIASKALIVSFGFANEPIFIAFWIFTIAYTMAGGLKAVVWTDIFQTIFIILIFAGMFLYAVFTEPQTLFSLHTMQSNFDATQINYSQLIATLLMTVLFSLIEQDLAQRFFAARTKKIATFAALGATAFMLVFSLIPIYFGMQAALANLAIPTEFSSPLIPYLATFTNEFVLVLAACGIIAAITSTADSLLCAISSNIAYNFDISFLGFSSLTRSKIITLLVGMSTLVASYYVPQNIIQVITSSYEISVVCLFVPLIFSYFTDYVKKEAAIGAIIGGLIGFVGFRMWEQPIPKEILSLGLSLLGYGIGNNLSKK